MPTWSRRRPLTHFGRCQLINTFDASHDLRHFAVSLQPALLEQDLSGEGSADRRRRYNRDERGGWPSMPIATLVSLIQELQRHCLEAAVPKRMAGDGQDMMGTALRIKTGRFPRWLIATALMLAALVAIGGAAGWLMLRASLPVLDGRVRGNGLSATVTIDRDALGVPTISGVDRGDLAYATGFLHAQDRFFQMDLLRRAAAGELSELLGPAALDLDRRHRLHRFRNRALAALAAAPVDERRLVELYRGSCNPARAHGGRHVCLLAAQRKSLGRAPRPGNKSDSGHARIADH
jgi:Penicillin amidase